MLTRPQALCLRESAFNCAVLFLILGFICAAPSLMASADPLQPQTEAGGSAATPVNFVTPGDMNTGALLLKSGKDGQFVEAPRLNYRRQHYRHRHHRPRRRHPALREPE